MTSSPLGGLKDKLLPHNLGGPRTALRCPLAVVAVTFQVYNSWLNVLPPTSWPSRVSDPMPLSAGSHYEDGDTKMGGQGPLQTAMVVRPYCWRKGHPAGDYLVELGCCVSVILVQ